MKRTNKNAGTGFGFLFHGSFSKKSDAIEKEKSTPGSFVKFAMTKQGGRFLVMSPRKNPRKGSRAKNVEFGEFEKGVFHPWTMRPRTARKKAVRKMKNTKARSVRPFSSLRGNGRNKKNPGELVILGLGNPKRRSGKKEKRHVRRNAGPIEHAKQMFSKFHGRQASGVYEMQRSAKARKDYAILGPLVAIGINAEKFDQIIQGKEWDVEQWDKLPHLSFMSQSDVNQAMRILGEPDKYLKGVPLLATSPKGKQLYVISEEPLEIDLSNFETDASKDFVDLGEATFVNYVAQKPNDPKEWIHTFGEEGGQRPRLVYDRINKVPMLVGGSYRIEAPGIID